MNTRENRSTHSGNWHALAWAVGSGVAFSLSQPGRSLPGVGCLAVAFLLMSIRTNRIVKRAACGALAGGLGSALAAGNTAAVAFEAYFKMSAMQSAVAWILADIVLGALPFALFAALVTNPRSGSPLGLFFRVGAIWVSGELLRGILMPGAWLSLSASVTTIPLLVQSASIFGAWGVSFWLAGVGALLFRGVVGPDRRRAIALTASLCVALVLYGFWCLHSEPETIRLTSRPSAGGGEEFIQITLIQSGTDSRRPRDGGISEGERLAALAAIDDSGSYSELVVWPESAMHSLWPINSGSIDRTFMHEHSIEFLLLGVPWMEDSARPSEINVAALLLDREGEIVGRHLKTRLVPFAEDAGTRRFMKSPGGSTGFTAATSSELLETPRMKIGASICFEILFSSIAREQANAGAEILINLSNESWLGTTTNGSDHMLAAAVLRAVETRRPVLRATTTGRTAAIDSLGRVVRVLPSGRARALHISVKPSRRRSVFLALGDAPVVAVILGMTLVSATFQRWTPGPPA